MKPLKPPLSKDEKFMTFAFDLAGQSLFTALTDMEKEVVEKMQLRGSANTKINPERMESFYKSQGNFTICGMRRTDIEDDVMYYSVAKCHPNDEYDPYRGIVLALRRAVSQIR